MNMTITGRTFLAPTCALIVLLGGCADARAQQAQQSQESLSFAVTYDESIADSYTGRVYVMLGDATAGEPRLGPRWINPQPFFAIDVTDWQPGETIVLDASDRTLAFPAPLDELPAGEYAVQAVMRTNLDSHTIGSGEGTGYSPKRTLRLAGDLDEPVALHITEIAEKRDPSRHPMFGRLLESDRLEHVRLRSDLLSDFHGRDIYLAAAVLLPESYNHQDNDQRRYPALYLIPSFAGSEFQSLFMAMMNRDENADQIIKIGLDGMCRTGHHVYATSATNGPYADALVEELIPHLESRFRLTPAPHGRYLTGISSGGWSSLWLQIMYPDDFGGVWSFVPDPVDFRAFQTVNIYADGANMYRDEHGQRRPLGREGDDVLIWADSFAHMEHVIGEGGQLHSFEAVFSPSGPDGRPMPLYDRESGAIDPRVADAWKKYDINLVVQDRWDRIAPHLRGKIHIIAGEDDNFFLEDAVKLLDQTLQQLGADAEIEVLEGRDHGSTPSPDQFQRVDAELLEMYRAAESAEAS